MKHFGKGTCSSMLQRLSLFALAALTTLSLTACFGGGNTNASGGSGETGQGTVQSGEGTGNVLTDLGKMLQSEGRPYNSVHTAKVGESLTNSFFEWKVLSVETAESVEADGEEIFPNEDGYKFVLVDVWTKNTYTEVNPMSNSDFSILYTYGGETVEDLNYSEFMDSMYPDEAQQNPGDTLSGLVIFSIPASVTEFNICYYEFWDDNFEGDTYIFEVSL